MAKYIAKKIIKKVISPKPRITTGKFRPSAPRPSNYTLVKQDEVIESVPSSDGNYLMPTQYMKDSYGHLDVDLTKVLPIASFDKVDDSTPITNQSSTTSTVAPKVVPKTTESGGVATKKDDAASTSETPTEELSFWQKYKVAIISAVPILAIGVAVFVFRKKLFKGKKK